MSLTPRRLGAGTLGVLLAAGFLAAPAPAHAGVLNTAQLQVGVDFDNDPDVGVTCTQVGGTAPPPAAPFFADGVPVSRSHSTNATVTDNANVSDVTSMSGSITSTATATQANGQLSKLHIVTTSTSSLTTAINNTKCGASVSSQSIAQLSFDLVAPALVTLTTDTHRMSGLVELGKILGPDPNNIEAIVTETVGKHGRSTATGLLTPGVNLVGITLVEGGLDAPATAGTISQTGDFTVDVSFDVPGSASNTQSGKGGKYVTLSDGRNCAAGSLSMTWSKKAGKGKHRVIKKAVVKVDGAKVATIKKPSKNQVSTISGLALESAVDVEVSFKVKGKGTLTAERSYLACG